MLVSCPYKLPAPAGRGQSSPQGNPMISPSLKLAFRRGPLYLQFRRLATLTPSSRATWESGWSLVLNRSTAPSRNSCVSFFVLFGMVCIWLCQTCPIVSIDLGELQGAGPPELTGKTKGGFTTKVTAICDTKHRVYACRIDPGNDSDHKIAEEIELPGRYRRYVGDKGFSSSKFRRRIEASGHTHCIAQKSNEKAVKPFHKGYYRLRHNIENVFARMGRWTRLELRRERKASHFESFLNLWAISTWVKI